MSHVGQKRALAYALRMSVRCPVCNRHGQLAGFPLTWCANCGALVEFDVVYEQRSTRSGFCWVASVFNPRQVTGG